MLNRRLSIFDDTFAKAIGAVAKWGRAIIPSGRGSMAIVLPADVLRAAGVEPGMSSALIYQLKSEDGQESEDVLSFHIKISVNRVGHAARPPARVRRAATTNA